MTDTMTVVTRKGDMPIVLDSNVTYEAAPDLSSNYIIPISDATDEPESDDQLNSDGPLNDHGGYTIEELITSRWERIQACRVTFRFGWQPGAADRLLSILTWQLPQPPSIEEYRVTTEMGEVFTGTFNGTWPGSTGDGRSFLDVMVGDEASVRVASMALYVSEIRSCAANWATFLLRGGFSFWTLVSVRRGVGSGRRSCGQSKCLSNLVEPRLAGATSPPLEDLQVVKRSVLSPPHDVQRYERTWID